jgi:hypothetical protein
MPSEEREKQEEIEASPSRSRSVSPSRKSPFRESSPRESTLRESEKRSRSVSRDKRSFSKSGKVPRSFTVSPSPNPENFQVSKHKRRKLENRDAEYVYQDHYSSTNDRRRSHNDNTRKTTQRQFWQNNSSHSFHKGNNNQGFQRDYGTSNNHRGQHHQYSAKIPFEKDDKYPPKVVYKLIDEHVADIFNSAWNYGSWDHVRKLENAMKEMDEKLLSASSANDFRRIFGDDVASILLRYHLSTNGSLRKEFKRKLAQCPGRKQEMNNFLI